MPGKPSLIAFYDDDHFEREYTLTRRPPGAPKTAPPVPIPLVSEGWSNWKAQWRPRIGSPTVLEMQVDDSDAEQGIIRVELTSAQVRTMEDGGAKGVWDLQAEQEAGEPHTFLAGETTWRRGVTRP